MKVQEVKEKVRLQEWAAQIKAREESGLSVKQWCAKNGPSLKTYYNRQKRVREELLESMAPGNALQLSGIVNTGIGGIRTHAKITDSGGERMPTPAFAALPMPKSKGAAVTVWIGGHAVDIQNGADAAVVEQVLKVVSLL
jgi:hypothetical protein